MISLPIIFHEVTVTARKKRTFVVRFVFGGFLAFMVLCFLIGRMVEPGSQALGRALLTTFAWEMFLVAFALAPALTCGCISDERNAGTLGLLFLTHLNSADIVLGKFIGKGFNVLMLLAVTTPFLFVPILFGGVNWDTTVALTLILLSQLVIGLSVGVLASSYARSTAISFAAAYVFLLAYSAAFAFLARLKMLADLVIVAVGAHSLDVDFKALAWLGHLAPFNGLLSIHQLTPHDASITLLCCVILAALFLAVSVWRLPRSPAEVAPRARRSDGFWAELVPTFARLARPSRWWLDRNPMIWLGYGRKQKALWFELTLVAAACALAWVVGGMRGFSFLTGWLLWMAIKLIIAVDVARTLASEKEDGSMEMLLAAPLSDKQIVNGRLFAVFLRYGVLCLAMGCFVLVVLFLEHAGLASLLVLPLMASELVCVVCLTTLISIRAKTTAQAVTTSVATAVFVSTFFKGFVALCMCSFLMDPLAALVSYLILTSHFRRYAVR